MPHKLGVNWMSPIAAGGSLESPVAAWDPVLQMDIAYLGTQSGNFDAINVANGQIVWSDYLGAAETSSPLVENGSVWTTANKTNRIFKLNASTGADRVHWHGGLFGGLDPHSRHPSGGGVPTVYFASLGSGRPNGPVTAYSESTCSPLWSFSNYHVSAGVWSPLNYTVDANGVGLLLFGTDNPDSSVYAINAQTGAQVWRYQTYAVNGEDWDIGAGVMTTDPGVNGFADGVAYENGKDGILNALDLTTGALIWQFNFGGNGPGNPGKATDSMATPALSGTTLVFGDIDTLYAVNALTGVQEWSEPSPTEIKSSAAIGGPPGEQVVAYGDMGGIFHVVSLSTGASLYTYQTGGYITSSPADVQGNLLFASSDGFLYDFGLGGGNGSVPTTTVTSPDDRLVDHQPERVPGDHRHRLCRRRRASRRRPDPDERLRRSLVSAGDRFVRRGSQHGSGDAGFARSDHDNVVARRPHAAARRGVRRVRHGGRVERGRRRDGFLVHSRGAPSTSSRCWRVPRLPRCRSAPLECHREGRSLSVPPASAPASLWPSRSRRPWARRPPWPLWSRDPRVPFRPRL